MCGCGKVVVGGGLAKYNSKTGWGEGTEHIQLLLKKRRHKGDEEEEKPRLVTDKRKKRKKKSSGWSDMALTFSESSLTHS